MLSLFLLDYLYSFYFGLMPLKRALMLFPSKRFLSQSHACSTLSFRYTRVTYVMCLFILVVCGTCNLSFYLHLDLSETSREEMIRIHDHPKLPHFLTTLSLCRENRNQVIGLDHHPEQATSVKGWQLVFHSMKNLALKNQQTNQLLQLHNLNHIQHICKWLRSMILELGNPDADYHLIT